MPKVLRSEDVTVVRRESNFDRACEEAYRMTLSRFGMSDTGDCRKVRGWDRSCCHVEVRFVFYRHTAGMGGHEYVYEFVAEAVKSDDDDGEEGDD